MPEFPKLPKIDKNPIKTASGLIREAVSGIQEAAAEIDSAVKGIDSEVRAPIEEGKPPIEEIAPVALKEAPPEQKTTPTITTQEPEKVPQGGSTGVVTRQGLDPETMRWQLQEARAELWELEGHLKNYCKQCGADNSCCAKHSMNLIDIARETKSMTTDPVWDKITALGEEIKVKAHPDNIRTGKYFDEFPQLIVRVSELRKPVETQLIQLSKPELTLEEAQKIAAERAVQEIERRWEQEKK